MNIQTEKAIIIEQFKQIDDIDLINVIKSLLDYARHKKTTEMDFEVPENHKNIVRNRINQYKKSSENYLSWNDIENNQ